ncbi:hypothetical protein [Pedomonas mirosovicensis]|uniref:hypothetical protein n=1 Tax=Pedomonas mirosovicensis TaxID=2908641 RepID=UPI0021681B8B|nr:hypothetical protein [Pedomonas mirosovicensis]MCH8686472.1 hypothetical protein [Pedomonas mirosovicensis]
MEAIDARLLRADEHARRGLAPQLLHDKLGHAGADAIAVAPDAGQIHHLVQPGHDGDFLRCQASRRVDPFRGDQPAGRLVDLKCQNGISGMGQLGEFAGLHTD